jgi:cytochrome c556
MDKPPPAKSGLAASFGSACETENGPMKRTMGVVAALLLGVGAVMAQQDIAVQQQNQMKAQGKSMYGLFAKVIKGDTPYHQAAIDAAFADLEATVGKIATVFTRNPKEDVVNATFGASQKIWQNKADFDAKVPPVLKAIADVKGTVKDTASLKVAYDSIQAKCTDCHETYRVKLK